MQTALFAPSAPAAALPSRPARRHLWTGEKGGAAMNADLFGAPEVPLTIYRSGSSARWDFLGYRFASSPVGITATELSPRVIPYVIEYLNEGGQVFLDSGAFGRFRKGKSLDFEAEVFPIYEQIIEATSNPDHLLLVAPDIVGNQAGSLALQASHVERLQRWCLCKAHVIFPIQEGHANPVEAYTSIRKLLEGLPFVVGIPSNAMCWSINDVVRFAAEVHPYRMHLLGLSASVRARQWALRIRNASPLTQISCDACQLIAHAGVGRKLTDRCQSRLEAALELAASIGSPVSDGEADALPDVETFRHCLYDEPDLLTPTLARDLAIALDASEWESRFVAAIQTGFQDVFAQIDPEEVWLQERLIEVVPQLYSAWLRTVLAGPIRAYEVARLVAE